MNIKKISFLTLLFITGLDAHALDYKYENWRFDLDVDGMIGFINHKAERNNIIDDWDIKGQIFYNINTNQRLGAVYSIDADCVEDNEYIHDAFVLFEDRNIGRTEFGLTHSIARKMGLGLPDVGYLRINNKSILYKKLDLKNVLISDSTITTGHDSLRLNIATKATEYGQYGFSIAGGGNDYDYALDLAFKLKQPVGKVKTAYSLAISYMNTPKNYEENSYSPNINADWRGQIALGFNLQYNSWIFGTSARLIYDEKPIGKNGDGLVVGTGVSYDLLQSSVSLNYLFSDTTLWKHNNDGVKDGGDYTNTIIASFRYKYSQHTHLFMSGGLADTTPFFAVGIKSGF